MNYLRKRVLVTSRPVVSLITRTYVAPINDLNFLIKDVHDFPAHYKKLGFDAEVLNF